MDRETDETSITCSILLRNPERHSATLTDIQARPVLSQYVLRLIYDHTPFVLLVAIHDA